MAVSFSFGSIHTSTIKYEGSLFRRQMCHWKKTKKWRGTWRQQKPPKGKRKKKENQLSSVPTAGCCCRSTCACVVYLLLYPCLSPQPPPPPTFYWNTRLLLSTLLSYSIHLLLLRLVCCCCCLRPFSFLSLPFISILFFLFHFLMAIRNVSSSLISCEHFWDVRYFPAG